MNNEFVLFSGSSNRQLAEEIALYLKVKLGKVELHKFADGETYVNYDETVRGKDIYILQSTCFPQNDNLMELLIMIDAAKRAAAQRITCVIPYYGYGKQDRKTNDREPITAKLVANLIQAAGADAVLTMDLHADQIQGFFDILADFLYASGPMTKYFAQKGLKDLIMIAPDVGSTKRARKYAKILGTELAIIDKRRPRPNQSEVVNLIGEVAGKTAVIVDDEINTGGTTVNAAQAAIKNGAKEVYVMASHGVFAGDALKRIDKSPIKEVIVTNSIPLAGKLSKKVKVISVAQLFGDAIRCMHENKSLSQILKS